MPKIHLLRHYKVKDPIKKKLNSKEFNSWVELYDSYDLEYKNLDIPKGIKKVFVSTQNRAIKTAEFLKLDYELEPLVVEVEAKSLFSSDFRFSKSFWLILGRISWFFNFCASERKKESKKRAKEFIKKCLESEGDVLVVSHGLFLKVLIAEFKKLGFYGEVDFRVTNAKIYTLKK